jgi:multisubunit Na+/H+ antiporter MnhC subunit
MKRYYIWKRNSQESLEEKVFYMIMSHKVPDYIIALIISVGGISLIVLSLGPFQITIAQPQITLPNQTFSDLKEKPFL